MDVRVTDRLREGGGSTGKVVGTQTEYRNALSGNVAAQCFWLKNRRPSEWRDVQNTNADVGHYILSDRPLTESQWIEERAKVIDAKPSASRVLPDESYNS